MSEQAAQGDSAAQLAWQAMVYQINKYIGQMVVALHGEVQAILLSGGMVFNSDLVA
ncbi:hypothetical protein [Eremococcus coleocola]|uniref:Uncharacterized protein n=1 Tax=Eremococcus coleocola ACS-139-V-Col8 TaxID=908337 RepID=E4KPQ0_9LACT|nr:hypothetical protein [Eremococcus coleocola]EFR31307.1 hypothetical protein HMPREF9257_1539 [Eremococcus coleocola ACS-139-V-Col8]